MVQPVAMEAEEGGAKRTEQHRDDAGMRGRLRIVHGTLPRDGERRELDVGIKSTQIGILLEGLGEDAHRRVERSQGHRQASLEAHD